MIARSRHAGRAAAASVVLVVLYLVAALGILPSPARVAGWFGHASTERYPCEGCGCGCASAHECWTSCCCHDAHERLVWAIVQGVMPPAYASFSDDQWAGALDEVEPGTPHCLLCIELVKAELRSGIARFSHAATTRSCCLDRRPGRLAVHGSAFTCKGLKQLLSLAVSPPPRIGDVVLTLPEPRPGSFVRIADHLAPSRALDIPKPPPRA